MESQAAQVYFHQLPLKYRQKHFSPIGLLDVQLLVETHTTGKLVLRKSSVKPKHHAQLGSFLFYFLSDQNRKMKIKLSEIDNSYKNK